MHYESETGDITVALTGESLITRPVRAFREPQFLELVEILRAADVTFANAEMLFHDFEGTPHEETKGTFMRAAPAIAGELKWMGIDIVSTANNHAFDYMTEGVMVSRANLEKHGLVVAGTGATLTAARAPAYFDSPAGRVSLVSATDHINVPGGRAGDARQDVRGRPGANLIRVETTYGVKPETFEALRKIDEEVGFAANRARVRSGRHPQGRYSDSEDGFYFGPVPEPPTLFFRRSEEPGRSTVFDAGDWEANLLSIREARYMSDWVIFTLHCGFKTANPDMPPNHWIEMAHAAVEAGADIVVGHGPHRDWGIEIYEGKPIFYSLGDFFLQNDTVAAQPADAYARYRLGPADRLYDFYATRSQNFTVGQDIRRDNWESVVPVLHWKGRQLEAIDLHPVSLGMGTPLTQRGRPVLAAGEAAANIIERIRRCSEPFGTAVETEAGKGLIRVGA